ncbi:MAG: DUF1080 domain-containing protein [Candidatus Hydrogenedentes bacterium]|nr:DUF1080 domain-containing protein [Candidatus Hydrogenedentota bacterium]
MSARKKLAVVASMAVLLCGVALAAPRTFKGEDLHVDGGKLKKGDNNYTLRAIAVPDLEKPGLARPDIMAALNGVANVGATCAMVNLSGFSESGRSISDEAKEVVRNLDGCVDGRHMGIVCNVFTNDAPDGYFFRKRAAKAAAKAFRDTRRVLFLFDGPHSEAAVKTFHRYAPMVATIAPKGGDMILAAEPTLTARKPVVLMNTIPPVLKEDTHLILAAGEASYAALDKACADPREFQPFTPDNSILSEQERAEGWIALFDGKTKNGWVVLGDDKAWEVRDGELERVAKGSQGLRSVERYGDFILRWEWCLPEGGNNGVHLRAPRVARASRIGLEYQMLGDYGKEPDKNSTGSIYDVVPPTVNAVKPNGEWNSSEVTLQGSHVKYVLNGVTVQDMDMNTNDELRPRLRNGFIVLTEHSSVVKYRSIRLKKL